MENNNYLSSGVNYIPLTILDTNHSLMTSTPIPTSYNNGSFVFGLGEPTQFQFEEDEVYDVAGITKGEEDDGVFINNNNKFGLKVWLYYGNNYNMNEAVESYGGSDGNPEYTQTGEGVIGYWKQYAIILPGNEATIPWIMDDEVGAQSTKMYFQFSSGSVPGLSLDAWDGNDGTHAQSWDFIDTSVGVYSYGASELVDPFTGQLSYGHLEQIEEDSQGAKMHSPSIMVSAVAGKMLLDSSPMNFTEDEDIIMLDSSDDIFVDGSSKGMPAYTGKLWGPISSNYYERLNLIDGSDGSVPKWGSTIYTNIDARLYKAICLLNGKEIAIQGQWYNTYSDSTNLQINLKWTLPGSEGEQIYGGSEGVAIETLELLFSRTTTEILSGYVEGSARAYATVTGYTYDGDLIVTTSNEHGYYEFNEPVTGTIKAIGGKNIITNTEIETPGTESEDGKIVIPETPLVSHTSLGSIISPTSSAIVDIMKTQGLDKDTSIELFTTGAKVLFNMDGTLSTSDVNEYLQIGVASYASNLSDNQSGALSRDRDDVKYTEFMKLSKEISEGQHNFIESGMTNETSHKEKMKMGNSYRKSMAEVITLGASGKISQLKSNYENEYGSDSRVNADGFDKDSKKEIETLIAFKAIEEVNDNDSITNKTENTSWKTVENVLIEAKQTTAYSTTSDIIGSESNKNERFQSTFMSINAESINRRSAARTVIGKGTDAAPQDFVNDVDNSNFSISYSDGKYVMNGNIRKDRNSSPASLSKEIENVEFNGEVFTELYDIKIKTQGKIINLSRVNEDSQNKTIENRFDSEIFIFNDRQYSYTNKFIPKTEIKTFGMMALNKNEIILNKKAFTNNVKHMSTATNGKYYTIHSDKDHNDSHYDMNHRELHYFQNTGQVASIPNDNSSLPNGELYSSWFDNTFRLEKINGTVDYKRMRSYPRREGDYSNWLSPQNNGLEWVEDWKLHFDPLSTKGYDNGRGGKIYFKFTNNGEAYFMDREMNPDTFGKIYSGEYGFDNIEATNTQTHLTVVIKFLLQFESLLPWIEPEYESYIDAPNSALPKLVQKYASAYSQDDLAEAGLEGGRQKYLWEQYEDLTGTPYEMLDPIFQALKAEAADSDGWNFIQILGDTDDDSTPDINDAFPTNWNYQKDSDSDGIPDKVDGDRDGDGYNNAIEKWLGSNPDLGSNYPTGGNALTKHAIEVIVYNGARALPWNSDQNGQGVFTESSDVWANTAATLAGFINPQDHWGQVTTPSNELFYNSSLFYPRLDASGNTWSKDLLTGFYDKDLTANFLLENRFIRETFWTPNSVEGFGASSLEDAARMMSFNQDTMYSNAWNHRITYHDHNGAELAVNNNPSTRWHHYVGTAYHPVIFRAVNNLINDNNMEHSTIEYHIDSYDFLKELNGVGDIQVHNQHYIKGYLKISVDFDTENPIFNSGFSMTTSARLYNRTVEFYDENGNKFDTAWFNNHLPEINMPPLQFTWDTDLIGSANSNSEYVENKWVPSTNGAQRDYDISNSSGEPVYFNYTATGEGSDNLTIKSFYKWSNESTWKEFSSDTQSTDGMFFKTVSYNGKSQVQAAYKEWKMVAYTADGVEVTPSNGVEFPIIKQDPATAFFLDTFKNWPEGTESIDSPAGMYTYRTTLDGVKDPFHGFVARNGGGEYGTIVGPFYYRANGANIKPVVQYYKGNVSEFTPGDNHTESEWADFFTSGNTTTTDIQLDNPTHWGISWTNDVESGDLNMYKLDFTHGDNYNDIVFRIIFEATHNIASDDGELETIRYIGGFDPTEYNGDAALELTKTGKSIVQVNPDSHSVALPLGADAPENDFSGIAGTVWDLSFNRYGSAVFTDSYTTIKIYRNYEPTTENWELVNTVNSFTSPDSNGYINSGILRVEISHLKDILSVRATLPQGWEEGIVGWKIEVERADPLDMSEDLNNEESVIADMIGIQDAYVAPPRKGK